MNETQDLVLERLAQVVGEKKDSDHGLQSRLAAIEEQLGSLSSVVSNAAKPQSKSDDSDDVWPKRKQSVNKDDIGDLIATAVAKAVQPLADSIKQDRENDTIKDAQGKSFALAVQQYPDLKDPNSELSQIADKLFNARPDLAVLADAPMVISSMAKGILADTRAVNKEVAEHKRNAAVEKPKGTGNLEVQSLSEDRDRAQQAKELKEKIVEKSQDQGVTTEDYADMFRLNLEQIRAEDSAE